MKNRNRNRSQRVRLRKKDVKRVKLDAGIYKDSLARGRSVAQLIEQEERRLEMDPESPAMCELSALQRQMLARDLTRASHVRDFFRSGDDSHILLPEYIRENVMLGFDQGRRSLRLDDVRALTTRIDKPYVKQVGINETADDVAFGFVAEGGKFPSVGITPKGETINLGKIGVEMDFTYEAIQDMTLIKAALIFQKIGRRLERDMTAEAIYTLINGDGNNNKIKLITSAAAQPVYKDLIVLIFNTLEDHQEPTHVVVSSETFTSLFWDSASFPPFQSLNLNEQLVKTGEFIDPFGISWRVHEDMPDNGFLIFDKSTCLEYYEMGDGQMVESEKIIDKQFEKTVISQRFAFGKLFENACAYMKAAGDPDPYDV